MSDSLKTAGSSALSGNGASSTSSSSSTAAPAANIRVYVRVRPLNTRERESGAGAQACLSVRAASRCIELHSRPESKVFPFDHVADSDASQEDVFQKVGRPITDACMAGYNGTIFAYGQTGSGKTFTIQGVSDAAATTSSSSSSVATAVCAPNDLRGLMPRVFEYLISQIASASSNAAPGCQVRYTCTASFLEIYNEKVFDLLEGTSPVLALREDSRRGVYVEGLVEETVRTAKDLTNVMERGVVARRVGETAMNRESSRSHCVFTLNIHSRTTSSNGAVTERRSKFNLIDLAGSERAKTTQATGTRMDEAKNINRSLSALGNVIRELMKRSTATTAAAAAAAAAAASATGSANTAVTVRSDSHVTESHIPYRDSRLTFLLRDSLGGNSLTFLIACVSPASSAFFESLSTLKFAQMANTIRNNAKINADETASSLAAAINSAAVQALKADNERLKMQVQNMMAAQGLGARRLSLMPGLLGPSSSIMMMGTKSSDPTNMSSSSSFSQQAGLVTPTKLLRVGGGIEEEPSDSTATAAAAAAAAAAATKAAAAAQAEIQHLQTLLLQSHAREGDWGSEIEAYKAQVALLESKQNVDGIVIRMREKHIAALQQQQNNSSAMKDADASVREENARLHEELEVLRQGATQLTHAPDLIAQRNQVQILLDRIAVLEDGSATEENASATTSPKQFVPRHRVEFELQSQLLALGAKHASLEACYSALESRSPETILDGLSSPARRNFHEQEVARWERSEGFEARLAAQASELAKAQLDLKAESDMVAHLESQLAHALEATESQAREAQEALLIKQGYLLRAEAERAALGRTVAALQEQAAAQSAAALAALGDQAAEAQSLSSRLGQEVAAAQKREGQALAEKDLAEQVGFEASQRAALLAYQNEHLQTDLAAARKELEESRALHSTEATASKASLENMESQLTQARSQISTLTSELAASVASCEGLSSSLRQAESEVSSLSSSLESSREDLESAMFKLEGVQEDIDSLNSEFGFQAAALEQSREQTAQALRDLANRDAKIASAQTALEAKDQALRNTRAELEQARSARSYEAEFLELQELNTGLNAKLREHLAEIEVLRGNFQSSESARLSALDDCAVLNVSRSDLERSVAELRAALQEHSSRLRASQDALEASEGSAESLRRALEVSEATGSSLAEQIEAQTAEINQRETEAREQAEQAQAQIQALTQEVSQVTKERAQALQKLSEAESAVASGVAQIASLQTELVDSRAVGLQASKELETALAELENARKETSEALKDSESLRSDCANLRAQLAEIIAAAQEIKSGAQSAAAEDAARVRAAAAAAEARLQASATAALEALKVENVGLVAQVASVTAQANKAKAAFDARRKEFEGQQAQFARMLSEFESHKRARDEEIASLRGSLNTSEGLVASLRKDLVAGSKDAGDLRGSLAKVQAELDALRGRLDLAEEALVVASRDSDIALALQGELGTMQERLAEQQATFEAALTQKDKEAAEALATSSAAAAAASAASAAALLAAAAAAASGDPSEVSSLQDRVSSLVSERHAWLAEMESVRRDESELLSNLSRTSAELVAAREALVAAREESLSVAKEVQVLQEQNVALTGHQNQRQKIQLHQQIKKENDTLKQEKVTLERELRKFKKLYTMNGGGSASAGGAAAAAAAGSLEKDLQLADEHLKQGEQAQVQLRALMQQVAKVEAKVAAAAAAAATTTNTNTSTPLGDITNHGGASSAATAATAASSSCGGVVQPAVTVASVDGADAFPSCLQSLSTLSTQLCSSHAQLDQLRRELSTLRKQEKLRVMKEQLMRTTTELTSAEQQQEEQENIRIQ